MKKFFAWLRDLDPFDIVKVLALIGLALGLVFAGVAHIVEVRESVDHYYRVQEVDVRTSALSKFGVLKYYLVYDEVYIRADGSEYCIEHRDQIIADAYLLDIAGLTFESEQDMLEHIKTLMRGDSNDEG